MINNPAVSPYLKKNVSGIPEQNYESDSDPLEHSKSDDPNQIDSSNQLKILHDIQKLPDITQGVKSMLRDNKKYK